MKEYKLSRKSKYSVFYLLCGLFMFFFMFAILNLCSFASQDGTSAFPYYVIDRYNTDNYTEMFPGGTNYSSLVNNTSVDKYYHLVGRVNVVPDSLTNTDEEFSIVLNTSDGSFNVCSSSATSNMGSYNFSFDIYFKGKYSSLVRYEKEHVGGVGSQYAFYTYTVLIDSCVEVTSSLSPDSIIPDYASYNYVYNVADLNLNSNIYGISNIPRNTIINYSFPNYNQSNFMTNTFYPKFVSTSLSNNYLLRIRYKGNPLTSCTFNIYQRVLDGSGSTNEISYTLDDFVFVDSAGSYRTYYLYFDTTHFDYDTYNILYFSQSANGGSFQDVSFSVLQRTYTINDYMSYIKDNYYNISPSVSDLNQNTAQSVSDIGTAQTFETSAFDNFDTQFSNSGLDTFSMSFASTPLLWVSSIITTFYNNMPSTFQYLLMFVAFVGILCTVLNVFGRVAQRFGGGDNATKLNSKDVFSKIEKNGSI